MKQKNDSSTLVKELLKLHGENAIQSAKGKRSQLINKLREGHQIDGLLFCIFVSC